MQSSLSTVKLFIITQNKSKVGILYHVHTESQSWINLPLDKNSYFDIIISLLISALICVLICIIQRL
jgi:hypothetical protein